MSNTVKIRILTILLAIMFSVTLLVSFINQTQQTDIQRLQRDARLLETELACYNVGYHQSNEDMPRCAKAQKQLSTEYLCDKNECWAEVL